MLRMDAPTTVARLLCDETTARRLATYFSDATFNRMDPKLRDGFLAATQVQVGRLAAGIAEDQRMPLGLRLLRPQHGHGDLVQGTAGEAAPLEESGVGEWDGLVHAANSIRVKLMSQ